MIETEIVQMLASEAFKNFIAAYLAKITGARGGKRKKDATEEALVKTIEQLSEKQAEAITFEHIYVNLLEGKISNEQATEIIFSLGYEINPNPIQWLQKKLSRLREWIMDSVKFLRIIGKQLDLRVKEITLELGLTPKVTITFTES